MSLNVAILGASNNPYRYAWLAQKLLIEKGYPVFPVSITENAVGGIAAYRRLTDIKTPVDTVTVYLNPNHVEDCLADIVALKPRRVIFNPGSESSAAIDHLEHQGISVEEACTLVLLRTGQFDSLPVAPGRPMAPSE